MLQLNSNSPTTTDLFKKASEYIQEAKKRQAEKKFESAIAVSEQALTIYEQLEEWEELIKTRQNISVMHLAFSTDRGLILPFLEQTLNLSISHLGKNHLITSLIYIQFARGQHRFGNYKLYTDYYFQALEIRKKIHGEIHPEVALCYGAVGTGYMNQGQYSKAIDYLKKAFEGITKYIKNAQKNAQNYSETLEKKLQNQLTHIQTSLGLVYMYMGKYDNALTELNDSLKIKLKYAGDDRRNIAFIYLYLSSCYGQKSDYDKALLYGREYLSIIKKMYGEAHFQTGNAYSRMGSILLESLKNDFSPALEYLHKAIPILEESVGKHHPDTASAYTNLGITHSKTKQYEQSIAAFQEALNIRLVVYDSNHPVVAEAYNNLGTIYMNAKQFDQVFSLQEKVLKIRLNTLGKLHPFTAQVYSNMSEAFYQQKKYKEALSYVQNGFQSLLVGFTSNDIYQNPSLKNSLSDTELLTALELKASIVFEYYKEQTAEKRDYDLALSTYQLAGELIGEIQKGYQSEGSQLQLFNNEASINVYSDGIKVALSAPKPSSKNNFIAFNFSERTKASLLLSSLQNNLAKASAAIPSDLLQKEKELKITLTDLNKKIQKAKIQQTLNESKETEEKDIHLGTLQNQFFEHSRTYSQLIEEFEQSYPDYYQLKYNIKTVSVESIQNNLSNNQWMISYFVGKTHYYIFFIGKDVFEVLEYEKPNDFEALVNNFLQSIQQHQLEVYAEKAYELYQYLLQPIEMYLIDPLADFTSMEEHQETTQMPKLTIIPHGILNYVPFEALVCTRTGKRYETETSQSEKIKVYQTLDYLLFHCEVSYHYSATLWHYLLTTRGRQGEKATIKDDFVGFAPVYETRNENKLPANKHRSEVEKVWELAANEIQVWASRSEALRSDGTWTPLPHSKTEAQNIADLFEGKGFSAQTFLHERATKEHFREAVERSRFLLIAAHGVVNDKHPKLSGLVFSPNIVDNGQQTVDGNQISNIKHEVSNNEPRITNHKALITNHQNDCILSMEETYHLKLNADLVVLSSCESGIGELAKGEGMMAVNRGFLYAGAKNVVSTLFKVYDKPSSLLTQYLFEGILKGKAYSESLRLAKLRLLKEEEVDVKSWCGFVLIGE